MDIAKYGNVLGKPLDDNNCYRITTRHQQYMLQVLCMGCVYACVCIIRRSVSYLLMVSEGAFNLIAGCQLELC